MKSKTLNKKQYLNISSYSLLLTSYFLLLTSSFFLSSCGYHVIGAKSLPFNSVTIKPVINKTFEPRLEERLHMALSKEFIRHGINIVPRGDIELDTAIIKFDLGEIAVVDERVKEQSIIMRVDIKVMRRGETTEFLSVEPPIQITFPSAGSVNEAVIQKQKAIEKACAEIARELIGRLIIRYVQ
ncbi:MAG: hypothetical protein HY756_02400 [Nitrospirae bacterium]|nr:hypothetical protein [Nitrospirota bacterium]